MSSPKSNCLKEQELCKSCGFCCDGTLFNYASSYKDDLILDKMEQTVINNEYWIKLPCAYFCGSCTVYDKQRPSICGDFKCQLLTDMSKGVIDFNEAQNLIQKVTQQRNRIELLLKSDKGTTVKQAMLDFQNKHKSDWDTTEFRMKYANVLMELASFNSKLSKFI